ncbi:amino acid ABC transporter permease [Clostridium senegalense]|uniref:amino acid ABC transporter permease n=1 Tax=Clostridium senegalense TaxID=1465809 RepID=UPI001C0FBA5A|nr:amino acid ABC transporter permease [Clostridium senegalense]MBU5228258.1 amino acid ABC transporter permease [Clostridium senegalense]
MVIFDLDFALNLIPLMLKYLMVTLKLSFLSLIFALILGVILAIIVDAKVPMLSFIAKVYVSFFRGTPLVAQLFFIYFGLIQIIPMLKGLSAFTSAVIALSLNAAAYCSESLRGAISSIDKGQMEAAYAFGMTYYQGMIRIVLPQAIKVAIPTLVNVFADIVKGSSLAFTIGVTEIMATAQSEAAAQYKFLEAFTCVILVYWALSGIISIIQSKLEKVFSKA